MSRAQQAGESVASELAFHTDISILFTSKEPPILLKLGDMQDFDQWDGPIRETLVPHRPDAAVATEVGLEMTRSIGRFTVGACVLLRTRHLELFGYGACRNPGSFPSRPAFCASRAAMAHTR